MLLKIKNIPQSLNDCTLKQLYKIIELSKADFSLEIRKIMLFYILIENQGNIFQKINYWFQLSFKPWYARTWLGIFMHDEHFLNININVLKLDIEELFYEVEDLTSFIFNEKDSLTKQKIPEFRHGWVGPQDYFSDLTFQQFRLADVEFYAIIEEKEITGRLNITNDFIRALYINKYGNAHSPIYLSNTDLQIILMYYIGNRKQLEIEFPHVFKKSKSSQSTDLDAYNKMWEDILDSIAQTPEKYEVIDDLNVRSVLKNLDRKFELNAQNPVTWTQKPT